MTPNTQISILQSYIDFIEEAKEVTVVDNDILCSCMFFYLVIDLLNLEQSHNDVFVYEKRSISDEIDELNTLTSEMSMDFKLKLIKKTHKTLSNNRHPLSASLLIMGCCSTLKPLLDELHNTRLRKRVKKQKLLTKKLDI